MKHRGIRYTAYSVAAVTVFTVLYYRSLGASLEDIAAERVQVAGETHHLQIALVRHKASQSSFGRGAELAAWELNRQAAVTITGQGGTRTRRMVKLVPYDQSAFEIENRVIGRGPEPKGLRVAREVAKNTEIVAVIGHDADSVAPATIVYERAGLLFLAPTTADSALPRRDSEFVIRLGPSQRQMSEAMVSAASQLSQVRSISVALLYPRRAEPPLGEFAAELVARANKQIADRGEATKLEVAFARAYDQDRQEYRSLVRPLVAQLEQIDLILIADVLPAAAVIRQEIEGELVVKTGSGIIPVPIVNLDAIDRSLALDHRSLAIGELREVIVGEAASLVVRESKLRGAILASRTPFGRRLRSWLGTNIELYTHANGRELEVVVNQSFDAQPTRHAALVSDVLRHSLDFVLVADRGPAAIALIDRLRRAGYEGPVICPLDLEAAVLRRRYDPRLANYRAQIDRWTKENPGGGAGSRVKILFEELATAGYQGTAEAVRGYVSESKGKTYVVSTFNSQSSQSAVPAFIEKYRDRFNELAAVPDADAALGYVAVRLIARACQRADSLQPKVVAEALRHIDLPDSILGHNSISDRGELLGLDFVLKCADADGNISVLPLGDHDRPKPAARASSQ